MKFQLAINMERMADDIGMEEIARHTLEMVQMAEEGGFHIVWAAEHHALEMTIAPDQLPVEACAWSPWRQPAAPRRIVCPRLSRLLRLQRRGPVDRQNRMKNSESRHRCCRGWPGCSVHSPAKKVSTTCCALP